MGVGAMGNSMCVVQLISSTQSLPILYTPTVIGESFGVVAHMNRDSLAVRIALP